MLPGKETNATTIFEMLRRHLWKLVLPPFATLFLALLYSGRLPDVFQADVLITIVAQRVPDSVVRSTVSIKTEERLSALETLVLSRTPLEQLILELDLFPYERTQMPMEDVVALMRKSTFIVLERPRTGPRGPEPPHAFHVQFRYPDAQLAATVAQRLGTAFVDQNARDRGALADATNQFLGSQLAQARTKLEAQEAKLKQFRELHGSELPTQMQANMQVINSNQLQIQALVEATARSRDRRLMNERIYNELVADQAAPPPPVAVPASGGPATPAPAATTEAQLASARGVLQKLQLKYQVEHPDVQRVLRVIAELEPKAAAERAEAEASGTTLPTGLSATDQSRRDRMREMRAENDSLDRQIAFNEAEEKRLRQVVSEYQRRIEAVPGVESQWASLTRDYDTQMAAYKELLTKSEQSNVALDLERRQIGEQFRILDSASVPTKPISPNRLIISAIGFGIGLVIGFGIALLLELRDTSFRSESDVVESLLVPVLAMVPHVATSEEKRRRKRRSLITGSLATATAVAAGYVFWTLQLWRFVA